MKTVINLVGKSFGRLTVVEQAEHRGKQPHWFCQCECGGSKTVSGMMLREGRTQSCGCLIRERARIHALSLATHGATSGGKRTPTYGSWMAMRRRCNNPSADNYARYGGAGIRVCDRWDDYSAFLEDVGPRPVGTTIDRWPNPAGNYEPGNVRWATPEQQANNRRRRHG